VGYTHSEITIFSEKKNHAVSSKYPMRHMHMPLTAGLVIIIVWLCDIARMTSEVMTDK
jgi:hypothetical protein